MDARGIRRGRCNACEDCDGFTPQANSKSCECDHPPGRHQKLDGSGSSQAAVAHSTPSVAHHYPMCSYQGCKNNVHFDLNSQQEYTFCKDHIVHVGVPAADSDLDSDSDSEIVSNSDSDVSDNFVAHPGSKCAIEECRKPKYVDANGTEHDCCGYTHAMELARRKIIKQIQKDVVKGVTHCLLPDCNRPTWPFMNYCGRTHAQQGKRAGLVPPVQPQRGPKDPTRCELPGCMKPKYVEGAKTFDFCGRTHANEAERIGFTVQRGGGQADVQDDTICIIPECTRPKYKDPSTGDEHDCCGTSHAELAKTRNIQSILTSKPNVRKFLAKFSNLTVVELKDNLNARSGGTLYKKFMAARNSLPEDCRTTTLAFHGTDTTNIDSICTNGYDPSRRKGQAYGVGEYFATTPNIPMGYCCGGGKMLLNELLLGRVNEHHTKHGDIIVMKKPEHDLPRFVVTFK